MKLEHLMTPENKEIFKEARKERHKAKRIIKNDRGRIIKKDRGRDRQTLKTKKKTQASAQQVDCLKKRD